MKKLHKIFFLSLLIPYLLLSSCTKEEECLSGIVRFTNTSTNPYDLYLDGAFQTQINGNTFYELDLLEGKHTGKVEQVSGYILFPTVVDNTLNVFGCQESEWVFP